ncbi:MAG TPA: hypothetical protein PLW74_02105 [Candidatus Dojkabacteria bacterium]|nr:hypothetical protein [Candidatus Dojkabacteria bacterium]
MATPREIQKQVTRPTSAVIMMLLWEAFLSLFPNAINTSAQEGIGKIILAIGLTGVIDKIVRNRKELKEWFKSIFTKKEK